MDRRPSAPPGHTHRKASRALTTRLLITGALVTAQPGVNAEASSAPALKTEGLIWPASSQLKVPVGPGWASGTLTTGAEQPISLSDQRGRLFSARYAPSGQAQGLERTLRPDCRAVGSVKTTPLLLAGPLAGELGGRPFLWNDGGGSTLEDGERQRFWMWVYSPAGGRMVGTWRCRGGEELMATLVLPARRWTQITLSRFLPTRGVVTSTLQMNQGPGLGVWSPAWLKTGSSGVPASRP